MREEDLSEAAHIMHCTVYTKQHSMIYHLQFGLVYRW